MVTLSSNHSGACPVWALLSDEVTRCQGRSWERMFVLQPAPPTSAIKYSQTLHSTKSPLPRNHTPQYTESAYSIIPRIIHLFSLSCGRETFSKIQNTKESIPSQRKSRELDCELGKQSNRKHGHFIGTVDPSPSLVPCAYCQSDLSDYSADRRDNN